ncbi:MAG: NUDIX domain-containing protein [Dehalococcoidia bacterium]
MAFPGMNGPLPYIPDPLGVRELNISDEWRGRWVEGAALPDGVPVLHGYAVVICDDKGYVTRPAGDARWGVVEGVVAPNETPLAWAKRAAKEQASATAGVVEMLGYLDCRATSHNAAFPVGTPSVRPIYLFAAKTVKELGKASGYERRRLPLNELAALLRSRYPEFEREMSDAVNRYMVLRAKGEV